MKSNATAMHAELYERKATPKTEGSGGLCIVELVDGGYTPTFAEIEKAFWDGRNIMFRRSDGMFYRLENVSSNDAGLIQIAFESGCTIFPDGHAYDD